MDLQKLLTEYKPLNVQEATDKLAMLQFIKNNKDYLTRDNLTGHFTSSAIIVNQKYDKVLFIHHNIYNAWGWTGGHNDGDEDAFRVAIKEAKEETGLESFEVHKEVLGIDTIYVKNHIRKGNFVPDHLHFNVTYLVVANDHDVVQVNENENSGVKWFDINNVFDFVDEPRMIPVYSKLFENIDKVRKSDKINV